MRRALAVTAMALVAGAALATTGAAVTLGLGTDPRVASDATSASPGPPGPTPPKPDPSASAAHLDGFGPAPPTRSPTAGAPTTTPSQASAGRTVQAYVTGYSWHDNSPAGSPQVSHPVIHEAAAGTGTYADPITVAVGHSIVGGSDILDWPAGTRFYIPTVRRYFIVEDTCGDGPRPQDGPCHADLPAAARAASTWLDVWIDGRDATAREASACAEAITGVHTVVVRPLADYPVESGPLFQDGGCAPERGNALPQPM
jgi:hypothetical protein